jgi:hypothetical protein
MTNSLLEEYWEFIARVRLGLYEEYELVMFIMQHLLDPSQSDWLNKQKLQIADLLNGRFNGEQEPTIEAFFTDWNLKCGTQLFKL